MRIVDSHRGAFTTILSDGGRNSLVYDRDSNDGVLIVQEFSNSVVVGADHPFHSHFASGVALESDGIVDDENAAGKFGRESGFE